MAPRFRGDVEYAGGPCRGEGGGCCEQQGLLHGEGEGRAERQAEERFDCLLSILSVLSILSILSIEHIQKKKMQLTVDVRNGLR